MTKFEKLYKLIIISHNTTISFVDLVYFLKCFGFEERIKGDHHIFTLSGIAEIINIQPDGKSSKKYQIEQVRKIVLKYKLEGDENYV